MKRIGIAVAILLIVCAASVLSIVYQSVSLKRLLDMTGEILAAYDNGEREACKELAAQFSEDCEKSTTLLLFFIRHSEVSALTDEAGVLAELIRRDMDELFLLSIMRCREIIVKLDHLEAPRADNIF